MVFYKKKRMVENEKKKLFLVNGDFFRNVKECIILRRSLVTIHTQIMSNIDMLREDYSHIHTYTTYSKRNKEK